jgi:hypothetical protein
MVLTYGTRQPQEYTKYQENDFGDQVWHGDEESRVKYSGIRVSRIPQVACNIIDGDLVEYDTMPSSLRKLKARQRYARTWKRYAKGPGAAYHNKQKKRFLARKFKRYNKSLMGKRRMQRATKMAVMQGRSARVMGHGAYTWCLVPKSMIG